MRSLSLAVVAIAAAGSAQIASAADMPVKAPAYKAPAAVVIPPTWTGLYVGLAGGYGWGRAEQTDATPFTTGRYSTHGGLIGATLGYNWQSGAAVFGVETDLSWASIKGSTVGTEPGFPNCFAAHCESKIRDLGTVRGRIGYAWQNWMPYFTGGLAYANIYGKEGNGFPGGSGSKWVAGYTVGGGVEAMFTPNWSGKVEYLYVNLGNHKIFTDNFGGGFFFPESLRVTAQVVRVGVNYHFNYR